MKTQPNQSNTPSSFRRFAGPLLALAATAALTSPARTRADDTVNYGDTLRYHAALSPDAKPVPARRATRHLGFVRVGPHANGLMPPARVVVRGHVVTNGASRTSEGRGHFIVFPNAEATGAAQGQTVNRALNDLD